MHIAREPREKRPKPSECGCKQSATASPGRVLECCCGIVQTIIVFGRDVIVSAKSGKAR